jgi:transposase
MLTAWKNDPGTAWLYEVSTVALQQGLQHLQNAYVSFWARRAKYPTFKSKRKSRASATFTTSGFRYRDGRIWLAKMSAPLDIRWSRPTCAACGARHDRDVNAAKVLCAAGLAVQACGDGVRPSRA